MASRRSSLRRDRSAMRGASDWLMGLMAKVASTTMLVATL
jgi:hypothetical protein